MRVAAHPAASCFRLPCCAEAAASQCPHAPAGRTIAGPSGPTARCSAIESPEPELMVAALDEHRSGRTFRAIAAASAATKPAPGHNARYLHGRRQRRAARTDGGCPLIAAALGVAALRARGSGSARCAAVRRCVIAAYATRDERLRARRNHGAAVEAEQCGNPASRVRRVRQRQRHVRGDAGGASRGAAQERRHVRCKRVAAPAPDLMHQLSALVPSPAAAPPVALSTEGLCERLLLILAHWLEPAALAVLA